MIVALVLAALLAQSESPSPLPSATPQTTPAPVPVASPTRGPIIRVPSTWTKISGKPNTGNAKLSSLGQWLHIGDAGVESVNVIVGPNIGMSLQQVAEVNLNELKRAMPNGKVLSSHAVPLCNGTQGWQLRFQNTLDDTKMAITTVLTTTTNHIYVATYGHSASLPDTVEGLRVVNSLCPPVEAAAADSGTPPLQPPAGWSRGSLDVQGAGADLPRWLWYGPVAGTSAPIIIVTSFPSPMAGASDDDLLKSIQGYFEKSYGATQLVDKKMVTLCNVTQGMLVHLTGKVKSVPVSVVAVLSAGVPTSYMAFYMHQTAQPELPEAVTSIQSLCPSDRQSSG